MPYTVNKNHLKQMNKSKINYLQKIKAKCVKRPVLKNLYEAITSENLKTIINKKKLISIKNKFNLVIGNRLLNPTSIFQNLQDRVEKIATIDSSQVVLKQSKFWARSITWVIISGTTFALGWISIAKTDEVVIAMGILEPKGGVVDVQMPLQGIAREVLVKEGEIVKQGQTLIRLDTEITEAQHNSLKTKLVLNQTIEEKLKYLAEEGAVSEIQYLQQKEKVEQLKGEIKASLVTLRYQEIVSPLAGIVFELQPKGPGYVARSTEPVLKIVPLDNLIAKVEIESRKIGFVKPGKKVEISIDSFPSTDFGVIEGTLTRIGSDALPPDPSQGKGYMFPADIVLNDQYLMLKSGQRLPIQAGMSLTANIKLRKVTYLQLLLNKFSSKAESLRAI